ncbi:hypothetical protein V1J52_02060 [Streptomyces sp. TRM 70351]|uniref:hypothetical protein n=1 Tax=Streptomyces sp. TRM 70351 TaxID=3116552 RepID=UPI002E7ABEC3|nr:hypothetical protein [Streptomyces sp. TRM 70351]MEE1926974.1 hypothetical protein [Streptomyces sp. TRM 70351]
MTALGENDTTTPPSPGPGRRLTPRQARLVRGTAAAAVMAGVAVVMAVRFAAEPSLVTLGLYGVALILSGTAIVLSRRGRTKVATAVLGCGLAAAVLAEPLFSALA